MNLFLKPFSCSTFQEDSPDTTTRDMYVRTVAFSHDGKYLATGAEDCIIRVRCIFASFLICEASHLLSCVRLSQVWDISKKRVRSRFPGHESEIYALQFSNDDRCVISASGRLCPVLQLAQNVIHCAGDGTARIWDMLDGSCRVLKSTSSDIRDQENQEDRGITSVCLSPSGSLIATGSLDKRIRIWDATTGNLLDTLEGHTEAVYSVAFIKDGRGLVSGSLDKTMRHWDVTGLLGGGLRSPKELCRSKTTFSGHSVGSSILTIIPTHCL